MTTAPDVSANRREPELSGQIVVVIGRSAGVIQTGSNPERLERAAAELGALSSAAFDARRSVRSRSVDRQPGASINNEEARDPIALFD